MHTRNMRGAPITSVLRSAGTASKWIPSDTRSTNLRTAAKHLPVHKLPARISGRAIDSLGGVREAFLSEASSGNVVLDLQERPGAKGAVVPAEEGDVIRACV